MMPKKDIKEVSEEIEELDELKDVKQDQEEPIYNYEDSLTNRFVDTLVGEKSFIDYVRDYMNDKIWAKEENDDINYYDWLFSEHLIDSFISYSKSIVEDVNKKSKKKELKFFVENVTYENEENIVWHDIYSLIVKQNKGKRFAQYIKEIK